MIVDNYFVNDGGIKSKDAVDIIIEAVKQED